MQNNKILLLLFGATLSAFFATTCCLAPLIFIIFGISVSGLSFLTYFSPYSDYFLIMSILILLFLWINYFYRLKKLPTCNKNICKNQFNYLLIGTIFTILLNTYPYWIVYII